MRAPVLSDIRFIAECYEDWDAFSGKEPITLDDVKRWVRRWIDRDDEKCVFWDGIGLITYSPGIMWYTIDNILVHPKKRRQGYSKIMRAEFKDYLLSQGVQIARFEIMAGPAQQSMERDYPDGVES